MKSRDYPYIRAWGQMMGSMSYYINDQVELARRDGAPQMATYKSSNGRWQTYNDIQSENTKRRIDAYISQMRRNP